MFKKADKKALRAKRHLRVRKKISGTPERPRLSVYRSEKNIYAQIIDDVDAVTLVSASTIDKDLKVDTKITGDCILRQEFLLNLTKKFSSSKFLPNED